MTIESQSDIEGLRLYHAAHTALESIPGYYDPTGRIICQHNMSTP